VKGVVVPKVSKQTASQVEDMGVLESRSEELGGYTVEFTTFRADADATPFFKGLPDDRCQSPHWGYVLKGEVTLRYADREETFEAGDAYYGPPGHIPLVKAGTEIVEFSPTEEYRRTLEVLAKNFAALQGS
jgi:cupin domain